MRRALLVIWLGLAVVASALAGPPFLTDDPEPVDYKHAEAYLFTLGDWTRGGHDIEGPALEMNYGALPDTQLHLIFPFASVGGGGQPRAFGPGDTELGLKYRFIHENDNFPMVGVFPLFELPTGASSRGLGNGRTWYQLPVWLQKSWGPWTTYGGGGEVLNNAPGMRDHPYGGWLIQRKLNEKLTLGGEFFAEGRDTNTDHGYGALNLGGSYQLNKDYSLLFSAGHSVVGDNHLFGYLALYRTW